MGVLPGICEKFAQLMSASKGEIEMVVTSAAPLDAKVVQRLESAVGKSEYVGQGKKLKVVTRVSSSILCPDMDRQYIDVILNEY